METSQSAIAMQLPETGCFTRKGLWKTCKILRGCMCSHRAADLNVSKRSPGLAGLVKTV